MEPEIPNLREFVVSLLKILYRVGKSYNSFEYLHLYKYQHLLLNIRRKMVDILYISNSINGDVRGYELLGDIAFNISTRSLGAEVIVQTPLEK